MTFNVSRTFPATRLRRSRQAQWFRSLVAENVLAPQDLIWPVFIRTKNTAKEIKSLPSLERYTIDELKRKVEEAIKCGIPAIALFPCVPNDLKTEDGREAINPENLICKTIRDIKSSFPEIGIITDVALDPYTTHGHDGVLKKPFYSTKLIEKRNKVVSLTGKSYIQANIALDENVIAQLEEPLPTQAREEVLNDTTIEILCEQALIQAQAGADIIAPSDMMDGRVKHIRAYLDAHQFENVSIMSYAAKYASAFYGPFREAVGSLNNLGKRDKRSYQMDPANAQEALHEAALDIQEGADSLIVKPGLPYLDILYRLKEAFQLPTFAYHVSGEYAMLKSATLNGWGDFDRLLLETLLSFKRAGADGILTYAALEAAILLRNI